MRENSIWYSAWLGTLHQGSQTVSEGSTFINHNTTGRQRNLTGPQLQGTDFHEFIPPTWDYFSAEGPCLYYLYSLISHLHGRSTGHPVKRAPSPLMNKQSRLPGWGCLSIFTPRNSSEDASIWGCSPLRFFSFHFLENQPHQVSPVMSKYTPSTQYAFITSGARMMKSAHIKETKLKELNNMN